MTYFISSGIKKHVDVLLNTIINRMSAYSPFTRRLIRFILNNPLLFERLLLDSPLLFERLLLESPILFERITNNEQIIAKALNYQNIESGLKIFKLWELFRPVVQAERAKVELRDNALKAFLRTGKEIKHCLMDVYCEKDLIYLANGILKFPERRSLWTLLHEILIQENYFFTADTDSPRIIDCGTNFGLAIYYFKQIFPKAKIIGFEPAAAMRNLALYNIESNGYDNVEVLPYALSSREERTSFFISSQSSMTGSLTKRRMQFDEELDETFVECRKLSDYLDKPVHFLKIDIEGIECEVLTESGPFLHKVHHLFCEYHNDIYQKRDELGHILSLLEASGFDVQVGKSFLHQNQSERRPMDFVERPYSVSIWAKNKDWRY